MDLSLVWHHKAFLLKGTLVTIEITLGALALGLILGLIVGMGRVSRNPIAKYISSIYVFIIRGTPMLLQIYFFFFGIPQLFQLITGSSFSPDPVPIGIMALGINSGAYVAEIVRAGIQSVNKGQMEAARSLGLAHGQAMRFIILPQAFRKIIPPLANEFIVLLKDSSLVSVIGAGELMYSTKVMGARYYSYLDFLVGAGLVYLSLTFIISQVVARLERSLAHHD